MTRTRTTPSNDRINAARKRAPARRQPAVRAAAARLAPGRAQAACLEAVAERLAAHQALTLVTGAPGSGKSLLSQRLSKIVRNGVLADGARLDRGQLVTMLAQCMSAPVADDTDESLAPLRKKLTRKGRLARLARPVVIDDAERLPTDALSLVLQLASLQQTGGARLGFVLVGTPELLRILDTQGGVPASARRDALSLSTFRLAETRAWVWAWAQHRDIPVSAAFVVALQLLSRGRPGRVQELLARLDAAALDNARAPGVRELLEAARVRPGSSAWNRLAQALDRLARLPSRLSQRVLDSRGLGWASAAAGLALGVMIGQYAPAVLVHEVRAAATPVLSAPYSPTAEFARTAIAVDPRAARGLRAERPEDTSAQADAAPIPLAEPLPGAPAEASTPANAAPLPWSRLPELAELPPPVLESSRHPTEVAFGTDDLGAMAHDAAVIRAAQPGPVVATSARRGMHSMTLVARLADPLAARTLSDAPAMRLGPSLPPEVAPTPNVGAAPRATAPVVEPLEANALAQSVSEPREPVISPRSTPAPSLPPVQQPVPATVAQASAPDTALPAMGSAAPSISPPLLAQASTTTSTRPSVTVPAAGIANTNVNAKAAATASAAPTPAAKPAVATPADTRLEKRARSGSDDLARAGDAIALGRNTEALQLLRKTLAEQPGNHDARASLLAVLAERGKDDEWLEALAQAAAVSPERFGAAAISGHLESNRLEEAKALIDRMPERLRDARFNSLAGVLFTRLQRYGDALAAYDEALAGTPADAPRRRSLQLARAVVLEHLGRYDEARGVYRAALDTDAPASAAAFARSRLAQLDLNR